MESINQRVFKLLGEERGILSKLAKFLDVRDSNVSSWKNRGSDIPAKYIPKIAEFLKVSMSYILVGYEEKPNENSFIPKDEKELVDLYKTANEKGRYMAMGILVSNQDKSEESKKGA